MVISQTVCTRSIKISMVFQQSILDNDLTVMENLSIRNKLYKEAKSNHIDALIQKIGLTEFNIGMRTE